MEEEGCRISLFKDYSVEPDGGIARRLKKTEGDGKGRRG